MPPPLLRKNTQADGTSLATYSGKAMQKWLVL